MQNSRQKSFSFVSPSFWAEYYTYLHPLLGSDEVNGDSWQLVTAIHDEGDGLILCYTHEVIAEFILVMLVLVLLECTQFLPSKCILGFLCNVIDTNI
jgi:hypothetical protein